MAHDSLTVENITRAGLEPTMTAASADGHYFANDERTFLRVTNTSGSIVTVSVEYGRRVDGATLTDTKDFDVPATTGDVLAGPWPKADYDQPVGSDHGPGVVQFTTSAQTDVEVAAIRI